MSLEELSQFALIQTTQLSMKGRNVFVIPSTSEPVLQPKVVLVPLSIREESPQWANPVVVS